MEQLEYEPVLKQALALPEDARRKLLDELVTSLQGEDSSIIAAEWEPEIIRRLQQIQQKEVKLISWDELAKKIEGQLNGN